VLRVTSSRAWHLVRRPVGAPVPEDFALVEHALPDPGPGELLVRNRFLSVDPYMRGRMRDVKSYAPPYDLDAPMTGGAVGEVVASQADGVAVGDLVLHDAGWREAAVLRADAVRVLPPADRSPSLWLGVLGMPGLTAWAGLFDVAGLQDGEAVFVSGAAGAVGSLACQLAVARGCPVVGSAGSAEKVRWLEGLGVTAFDYRAAPVLQQLRAAAPDGVDVYFDNVGGEHLEAAVDVMKVHGRAAVCGMISAYNATEPPAAPRNLTSIVGKRLRLQGFLVWDHAHLREEFEREVGAMLDDGRVVAQETVVDGVEATADAFLGLLAGRNLGKMVVRL
jgi:NADPH-dependent curcumin reductase CurA